MISTPPPPLGAKHGVAGVCMAALRPTPWYMRRDCETTHSMNCGPRKGASGKFALSAAPFGVAPYLVVILEIKNLNTTFVLGLCRSNDCICI